MINVKLAGQRLKWKQLLNKNMIKVWKSWYVLQLMGEWIRTHCCIRKCVEENGQKTMKKTFTKETSYESKYLTHRVLPNIGATGAVHAGQLVSWLAKGLGLRLLCWGFEAVQQEIPREEASTLQIGSVVFQAGQYNSLQLHPCHRRFDQDGHQHSSSASQ